MNRTDLMEFVNLKFPYKLLALHGAQGPTVGNVAGPAQRFVQVESSAHTSVHTH